MKKNQHGLKPILRARNYKAIDLRMMVIWDLSQRSLSIHLVAMYMTVIRMIVDAQAMLAVGKLAFPAGRRSF
jgi:hypothetical protein